MLFITGEGNVESCISEEICAETAGCEDASRLAGCCPFSLEREYVLGGAFSTYFLSLICFWRGIFSLKKPLNVRRLGNDILKNCKKTFSFSYLHFRFCFGNS